MSDADSRGSDISKRNDSKCDDAARATDESSLAALQSLAAVRAEIDRIDTNLLELFNRRARCAQRVAELKAPSADNIPADDPTPCIAAAGSSAPQFYRPEREAEVLRSVRTRNSGPLPDASITLLFRELMSACLALECPLTVAYLGPEGTFTEHAARKHFGHAVELAPLASIPAVFRAVESGQVPFGVVPIENTTEGVVTHTIDCFIDASLMICGEVALRVEHALLAVAESTASIHTIHGHPQALAQCRGWLAEHLPQATTVATSSNAQAAIDAKAAGTGHAAIAAVLAAERYGLHVLAESIQDRSGNTTRFLVIGRQGVAPTGADKTSVMLATRNQAGALFDALKPIAEAGVSLTRIESRPARSGLWEYVFFLDMLGHESDPDVAACLASLEQVATLCKRLGSYPQAAT